jgi:hypothetical protein
MKKTYFGQACRKVPSHGTERYRSNRACVLCQRAASLAARAAAFSADPGRVRAQKRLQHERASHRPGRTLAGAYFHRIRIRAERAGMEFSLTKEWIEAKLLAGVCELSGLPLEPGTGGKRPMQPSFDRIDNNRGYTPANTRCICLLLNMAKLTWEDADVLRVARALVDRHGR